MNLNRNENGSPENRTVCDHGGRFFEAIGEDFSHLDRISDIINADVLDAWFEPAPSILETLRKYLAWSVKTSPPTHSEGFIRAVARARGVPERSVLPSSGSSSLMYLALPRLLPPKPKALLPNPTYGEYAHILKNLLDARIDRFPLPKETGFRLDARAYAEALQKGQYDIAVLVNPNSPTGGYVPRAELLEVLDALPDRTILWIDETYVEYVGRENSMEPFAADRKNVVVCKSMSKVYAMSGIRAAYLVTHPENIGAIARHAPPWSVSMMAQMAAVLALGETEYYDECYRQTALLRRELADALAALPGVTVYPGAANFILCEFGDVDADRLTEDCRAEGLYVRRAENMGENWGRGFVRIAVKNRDDNRRMVEILRNALAKQGLV